MNGQRIAAARALRWYQWVWMLAAVLGFFSGDCGLGNIQSVMFFLVYREVVDQ